MQIDDKVEKHVAKRNRVLDAKERLFRTTVSKLLSSEEVCVFVCVCVRTDRVMRSIFV